MQTCARASGRASCVCLYLSRSCVSRPCFDCHSPFSFLPFPFLAIRRVFFCFCLSLLIVLCCLALFCICFLAFSCPCSFRRFLGLFALAETTNTDMLSHGLVCSVLCYLFSVLCFRFSVLCSLFSVLFGSVLLCYQFRAPSVSFLYLCCLVLSCLASPLLVFHVFPVLLFYYYV